LSKTKDNEERKKLMLEIQALILKEKNKWIIRGKN
jgi:hypothetical protein